VVFVRRLFNKYVAMWRLSTQYCGGMEASNSKVRTMLLVVCNICLTIMGRQKHLRVYYI
jgi:hypothetical protein